MIRRLAKNDGFLARNDAQIGKEWFSCSDFKGMVTDYQRKKS
jgi:hypothetical protein